LITHSHTGTVNSGYLIGSVGGVKEKIEAAARRGFTKVLIPMTEVSFEKDNKTVDYVEYGKPSIITVIRVADIDEAMYEFTAKTLRKNDKNVEISPSYTETMAALASELCKGALLSQRKNSYITKENEDPVI